MNKFIGYERVKCVMTLIEWVIPEVMEVTNRDVEIMFGREK